MIFCEKINIYELDIGRSVYNFFEIYVHSNEIQNVAALIVYAVLPQTLYQRDVSGHTIVCTYSI